MVSLLLLLTNIVVVAVVLVVKVILALDDVMLSVSIETRPLGMEEEEVRVDEELHECIEEPKPMPVSEAMAARREEESGGGGVKRGLVPDAPRREEGGGGRGGPEGDQSQRRQVRAYKRRGVREGYVV